MRKSDIERNIADADRAVYSPVNDVCNEYNLSASAEQFNPERASQHLFVKCLIGFYITIFLLLVTRLDGIGQIVHAHVLGGPGIREHPAVVTEFADIGRRVPAQFIRFAGIVFVENNARHSECQEHQRKSERKCRKRCKCNDKGVNESENIDHAERQKNDCRFGIFHFVDGVFSLRGIEKSHWERRQLFRQAPLKQTLRLFVNRTA